MESGHHFLLAWKLMIWLSLTSVPLKYDCKCVATLYLGKVECVEHVDERIQNATFRPFDYCSALHSPQCFRYSTSAMLCMHGLLLFKPSVECLD